MRIVGPDAIVFGVDNMDACRAYLTDYGLRERTLADGGFVYEALDGTAIVIRDLHNPVLPAPLGSGSTLRQTVWGCEDQANVDAIAKDLSQDRLVDRKADGSIETTDDVGFAIAFRATTRRPIQLESERVNSPGASPGRRPNELGANQEAETIPRTLSHVVYFTPELEKAEAFYIDRLKFAVTDRFENVGPFLRPQANDDHHSLFLIHTPSHMQGLEHLAFHMKGPTELMLAGSRMVAKGYESFWGPGRHQFGSNWFWYFNSPMGAHVEYDADMDKHDTNWKPRLLKAGAEASQIFLFENVAKWAPGGGPPPSSS